MLASLLITLREGLEAALIVGIIAAYLVHTGRAHRLGAVWAGVAAALGLSLLVGGAVALGAATLPGQTQEVFEGAASLLAVAVLTWMIFWMRRHARAIKGDLQAKVDQAAADPSRLALPLLAFVAVAREGLETVLFLFAAFNASANPAASGSGALLGLAAAVAIGLGLFRFGRRINLRSFFQATGGLLIVIAAGVLAYGVAEFSEAGVLGAGQATAWDLSGALPTSHPLGALLRGLVGYTPDPSWAQVTAWLGYLLPALWLFYAQPHLAARRAARTTATA